MAWYRKWHQKAWGFWHAFEGLEIEFTNQNKLYVNTYKY